MNQFRTCPDCGEIIKGIVWPGGKVYVFEHKGTVPKWHHYHEDVEIQLDWINNHEK